MEPVYTVNQLKMYNTEYWNKEIRVEAEDNGWGRTATNYITSIYSGTGTGFAISNNSYLMLTDNTVSSLSSLLCDFPYSEYFFGKV